ncbi:hypothetical protein [Bacillus mycoides]|uniref:hypothetical protein n=1 Tax=Bacillus mycoides TaxID=1405 RepID=UPI003A80BC01
MELFVLTMDNGMIHCDERKRSGLIAAENLEDARGIGFRELVKWGRDLDGEEQQNRYLERVYIQNPTETEAGFEMWADWVGGVRKAEKRYECWSGVSTQDIYWFSVDKAKTLNGYEINSVDVKETKKY